MQCTKHPQAEAKGMCTYCGKPFCEDCLVEIHGKYVCKDDVNKVLSESQPQAQQYSGAPIINITNENVNGMGYGVAGPPKNKVTAILLCLFLGYLGVHRFYVGKVGTGILWLLTFGCFGIGVVIDLVLLIVGSFRDSYGRPLV